MSASTWWCPAGDDPLVEIPDERDARPAMPATASPSRSGCSVRRSSRGGGRSGGPPQQPRRRVTAARRVAVRCRRPPPPPVTPPATPPPTPPPTPPSTVPAMQRPHAARRRWEATGGPKTLGAREMLGTLVPSRCVAALSSYGYRLSRSPSCPSCPHSRSVRVFAHWTRRIATPAERRAPPPTSAAGTAAPR